MMLRPVDIRHGSSSGMYRQIDARVCTCAGATAHVLVGSPRLSGGKAAKKAQTARAPEGAVRSSRRIAPRTNYALAHLFRLRGYGSECSQAISALSRNDCTRVGKARRLVPSRP